MRSLLAILGFLLFITASLALPRPSEEKEDLEKDDDEDGLPILEPGSLEYLHAAYQNPHYDFERGYREALASQRFLFNGQCRIAEPCDLFARQYRSFDGSCNNLEHTSWGQAGTPYHRTLSKDTSRDYKQCGMHSGQLPSARTVSLNLFRRGNTDTRTNASMYVMLWGQAIEHDVLITPLRFTRNGNFLNCCNPRNVNHQNCCPLWSPSDDPFYNSKLGRPSCQSFLRSKLASPVGKDCSPSSPDVENGNSGWIDASILYGSSEERAKFLRSLKGGRMKVSVDKLGRHFHPISLVGRGISMEFGDVRGDSHVAFTMLNAVFLRNHNRLAHGLEKMHPDWDDEKLFQEARKINGAIFQHITYTDYIDVLFGIPNDVSVDEDEGHRDFYDPSVDGSVRLEFATVGYRLHTHISSYFNLLNPEYRQRGRLRLREAFLTPLKLLVNNTYDDLIRGMAAQPLHEFNNMYTPDMTEYMFKKNKNDWGMDIIAITVQRSRDHQLKSYLAYREVCKLGRARNWNDLTQLIAPELVDRIRRTYRRVEEIEFYVGALMEDPVVGSEIGPTMHCIIRDQFLRSRNGDRFFYTRPGMFTARQLRAIKSVSLADVLCDNADDRNRMTLPRNVFKTVDKDTNPAFKCLDHLRFDIDAWR